MSDLIIAFLNDDISAGGVFIETQGVDEAEIRMMGMAGNCLRRRAMSSMPFMRGIL